MTQKKEIFDTYCTPAVSTHVDWKILPSSLRRSLKGDPGFELQPTLALMCFVLSMGVDTYVVLHLALLNKLEAIEAAVIG